MKHQEPWDGVERDKQSPVDEFQMSLSFELRRRNSGLAAAGSVTP